MSVAKRETSHQAALLELLFDESIAAMPRNHNPCQFDGCANNRRARGLCSSHLWQLNQGKELTPLRGPHGRRQAGCDFPGCNRKHHGKGLCRTHLDQQRKGQPLRTIGGGRWVDPKGYVWIKCPAPGHPNAKRWGGWIAEHIWIMSQMIGRALRPGETVHHRNLIRSDNRPGNLELWTSHQPRGARVADMLAGVAGC